jgi:hypothetical protein
MSLNKFTDTAFGRILGLKIGCSELDTGALTCESVDATAQFLGQAVYTSLSDLQGFGSGQEHPLLPPGAGSLALPVDSLRAGSMFKVSCKGIMSCPTGSSLTFRLKATTLSAGTIDLVTMTYTKATNTTIKDFFLDFSVSCRQAGTAGDAEFQIFGEGRVFVDGALTPESFANDDNLNIFGTDEPIILQLTAESDNVALNIVSRAAEVRV